MARLFEEAYDAFLRWQFARSMRMQLAFLEEVLLLMADGIPLSDALSLIAGVSSPIERSVARWMLRRLDEGGTMSEAMVGIFRFDVVGAISTVGEVDVATNGLRVLDRLREQHKGRGDAVAELVRPGIYLTFALALYAFFAWQVWPRFIQAGRADDMPPLAQGVYVVGVFIQTWWAVMLAGFVVAVIVVRAGLRHWANTPRRWLDVVWPFNLYRELQAANSLEEIGILLTGGQDARSALDSVARHTTRFARMYLDRMRLRLDEGYGLSEILDVGYISDRDMARLRVLAEHQNLRETLVKTGVAARREILENLRRTARVLDIVGLLVVFLSFAGLVGGVYMTALAIQGAAEEAMYTSFHWQTGDTTG